MKNADYWIKNLNLEAHPEGGYFKEIYRSGEKLTKNSLPKKFNGDRSISTSIYFLLNKNDFSALHKIKSDELWYFHTGSSLTIHSIDNKGNYSSISLGNDIEKGHQLQAVVKANSWFGAIIDDPKKFTLVSCNVAPGFDFNDFELGKRDKLIKKYPEHEDIIIKLTRKQ